MKKSFSLTIKRAMNKQQYLDQLSQELHAPSFKRYKTARVNIREKNDIFSSDLMDMGLKNSQSIYRYILVVVDAWSKMVFVRVCKDKKTDTILELFKDIFKQNNNITPQRIWIDQGSEFINGKIQDYFKGLNITTYHTYSKNKSVYAERFIRTLKNKLYRWMTANNTEKWTEEAVNKIVDEYNNTKQSTTNIKPIDLHNNTDIQVDIDLYNKLNSKYNNIEDNSKQKFNIGDWVRVSVVKEVFEKGAEANWSTETYKVYDVVDSNGIYLYKLEDYNDKKIEGTFYSQELQKSLLADYYLIEKVIKTVKNKSLVVFVGFPGETHWINNDEMKDLI